MSSQRFDGHEISAVEPGSLAERAGLCAGMRLLRVNGESIRDQVDYLSLVSSAKVRLSVVGDDGPLSIIIHNEDDAPLGLSFGDSMRVRPLRCRNRCIFCFVDQLPPGMRRSLYIKDDDWRMSLMMGNYVTLTNLSDAGFARLIRRRASPVYLSIHALDPDVRGVLLGLGRPDDIRPRLSALRDAGLMFHAQIVMCPQINDGDVLARTLAGLADYYPAAQSVAVVPVGLTRHRAGLPVIPLVDAAKANETLPIIYNVARDCLRRFGTRFAYAADELYLLAGQAIPPDDEYENYPQIENGVGLLRRFAVRFAQAAEDYSGDSSKKIGDSCDSPIIIVTGVSAAPFLRELIGGIRNDVLVHPIINHYFGESITVAGLITATDIIEQLAGVCARELWIPESMLSFEGIFLDNYTVDGLSGAVGCPVRVISCDGGALHDALVNA